MTIRRFPHLPLLCVLVLCLLTSPVSPFGYVWCLNADGHVELEAARADDCSLDCPPLSAGNPPTFTIDAEASGCGPCLDVSTTLQWGSVRGRDSRGGSPVSLPTPFTPPAVAAHTPQASNLLTKGLVAETSPRISEPILHHRTIVLLI
jgi:hypothetical protein